MLINKALLLQYLLAELQQSLDIAIAAANDAREMATHEQSKPETQYDTVGLEASYLAHGQSQRVAELKESIHSWSVLAEKAFPADSEISAGALVEVEDEGGGLLYYLLGHSAGGIRLYQNEQLVTVISTSSPLGQLLVGKYVEDEIVSPMKEGSWLLISQIN